VDIRRAISDAYYGIFHATLAAAADQFVGAAKRATRQYALIYRSVSHGTIRELCLDIKKPNMPKLLARHAPLAGFGPDMKAYSEGIVDLQEKRLSADYDPLMRHQRADAVAAVGAAQSALTRFKNAPDSEREAFLALLVFKPR
jgi:hypothetical protein